MSELMVRDVPAATAQCHAANLHRLPDGTLACVWFGGTQEGHADICVWMSRFVEGAWHAPTQLSNDAHRSEQNPVLFNTPNGEVWLLHTAQIAGNQDGAMVRVRRSSDAGKTWSQTTNLIETSGMFVRQPMRIARNGDWLLPIFRCRSNPGERWGGELDTSAVLRSNDGGKSWNERDVPDSVGAVHMNIVDGVAFYRSRWADAIYRSVSLDDGARWSAPKPSTLPNNNSSIQAIRLHGGRIAIAFNDVCASATSPRRESLYDEIKSDLPAAQTSTKSAVKQAIWGTPRAPMTVAISDDDGVTWVHKKMIEDGDGHCLTNNSVDKQNRELSYPTIFQTNDGVIHLAYTHHRQRIRHVSVTESWLNN